MSRIQKILEEIEKHKHIVEIFGREVYFVPLEAVKQVIRKHMDDDWIPVEERTPEIGEYVLGTNKYGEVLIYHYGWNGPRTKKMFFRLCGAAATVTAWRPLPEPYRTERSKE